MPSLFRLIDEYLFLDSPDRITLCDDNRAYVRLPARGLRSIAQTVWLIITCSWTNILLPFTLAALLLDSGTSEAPDIFWLNYLALLPVVGLFRYASEVLSVAAPSLVKMVWSFTLGPFSLDTEIAFIALFQGKIQLVGIYIAGKIAATLFLTTALCFIASGIRWSSDTWNASVGYTVHALLMTAVLPYAMIAVFQTNFPGDGDESVDLSRQASVILLVLFCVYQVFRRTHSHRFERDDQIERPPRVMRCVGSGTAGILLICAAFVTYICTLPLLDAVFYEGPSATYGLVPSHTLFAFFCLPLLVEQVEFKKICSLAYRGDMDVSFEVATATSMNMLLFIGPLSCLIAWCLELPMDLSLGGSVEMVMLYLDIWIFSLITKHGVSNYLHGFIIGGLYVIEVFTVYLKPDDVGHI